MTIERVPSILIDSPVGPFSEPDDIRAWLKELDELEAEVVPNSDASETIASAREEAKLFLAEASKRAPE